MGEGLFAFTLPSLKKHTAVSSENAEAFTLGRYGFPWSEGRNHARSYPPEKAADAHRQTGGWRNERTAGHSILMRTDEPSREATLIRNPLTASPRCHSRQPGGLTGNPRPSGFAAVGNDKGIDQADFGIRASPLTDGLGRPAAVTVDTKIFRQFLSENKNLMYDVF